MSGIGGKAELPLSSSPAAKTLMNFEQFCMFFKMYFERMESEEVRSG